MVRVCMLCPAVQLPEGTEVTHGFCDFHTDVPFRTEVSKRSGREYLVIEALAHEAEVHDDWIGNRFVMRTHRLSDELLGTLRRALDYMDPRTDARPVVEVLGAGAVKQAPLEHGQWDAIRRPLVGSRSPYDVPCELCDPYRDPVASDPGYCAAADMAVARG